MSTVLVTGANRGIGLEFCRQLAERGDDVIAVCRQPGDDLEALDLRIESGVDVSDPDSTRDLADRLDGVTLDWLISNAGVLSSQTLGHIDSRALEEMHRQYAVNSLGPLLVTQALLDNLHDGSKVGIVTSRVGSIADNGSGSNYGYRMSKAAANMAGKSLSVDLQDRGIAVFMLHPGYVRTGMTRHTGHIDPDLAASSLIERMDALGPADTGTFWHGKGDELPW